MNLSDSWGVVRGNRRNFILEHTKATEGLGLGFLRQTPPVTNTWYAILDTDLLGYQRVAIHTVSVEQKNDEAAAKNVQVRLTINDVIQNTVLDRSQNSNVTYWPYLFADIHNLALYNQAASVSGLFYCQYGSVGGRKVKLEMRLTSAAGTNQYLWGLVGFSRLVS